MQDSAKYLIHADIRASGVVERSDVVGAIFGQTEGLLGDELDLRDLQESSKVGRIDVEIDSEGGRSFGTVTIASGLDKVETAVLAAGLETIDRVGPCRAEFEVTELEDAREAKRRAVVERATELLADFEESTLTSRELVEEVRQNVRVEQVTEYEGLPAGPRVADSDAIIVVEGRADVTTLLQYGIKNAIAVEGTDVPDAVADLTRERTVTAFLDGDRGGDLILKELAQVGTVDYVTFAPAGRSVEDLSRTEALSALRKKAPYAEVADAPSPHERLTAAPESPTDAGDEGGETGDADEGAGDAAAAAGSVPADTDQSVDADQSAGTAQPASGERATTDKPTSGERTATDQPTPAIGQVAADDQAAVDGAEATAEPVSERGATDDGEPTAGDATDEDGDVTDAPETLADHVEAVVGGDTGEVRLLDADFESIGSAPAGDAFEAIETAETAPATVVLDGKLTQRILDVAAQRGVGQIVARETGEFVKQPTNVRVRTAR